MSKVREKIFVVPVRGRRIKDPFTLYLLKDEGEWKPKTPYWLKKVRTGDVALKVAPPEAKPFVAPFVNTDRVEQEPVEKKTKKSKKSEPADGQGEDL